MCGKRRTRARNTVSPPWPESKTPIMSPTFPRGARRRNSTVLRPAALRGLQRARADQRFHALEHMRVKCAWVVPALTGSKLKSDRPRAGFERRVASASVLDRQRQARSRSPSPAGGCRKPEAHVPGEVLVRAVAVLAGAALAPSARAACLRSLRRFGRGATPEQGCALFHGA